MYNQRVIWWGLVNQYGNQVRLFADDASEVDDVDGIIMMIMIIMVMVIIIIMIVMAIMMIIVCTLYRGLGCAS